MEPMALQHSSFASAASEHLCAFGKLGNMLLAPTLLPIASVLTRNRVMSTRTTAVTIAPRWFSTHVARSAPAPAAASDRRPDSAPPEMDLEHRLLLAARTAIDGHELVERAFRLAAATIEHADPRPGRLRQTGDGARTAP